MKQLLMENGGRVPGKHFFKEVSKNIPMSKLLAEDLGVILQETESNTQGI